MDAVIALISEMVEEKTKEIDAKEQNLRREQPDTADEIMDDLRYYHACRFSFFWESCVWRLQGIFEGILDEQFLAKKRKYRGLRDRINSLKNTGYRLINEDQLVAWAKFRNELSHSPPKQLDGHGTFLAKNDLISFREFLVDILKDLQKQKNQTRVMLLRCLRARFNYYF